MTESFDWFTPHLPVPETAVPEDEFNQCLQIGPRLPEEQQ